MMTPTFYLTTESITERLAINFPGRQPTPEEWESAAREAEEHNEPDRMPQPVRYPH